MSLGGAGRNVVWILRARVLIVAGLVGAWLVGAGLGGCYETPHSDCPFLCAQQLCPAGYGCGDDDRCHRLLPGGELAECRESLPDDPSVVDGAVPQDAVVDAPEDAPIDASLIEPDAAR